MTVPKIGRERLYIVNVIYFCVIIYSLSSGYC